MAFARYPPRPTDLEEPDFGDIPRSRRIWTALVGTIPYARLANWSTLDSKPRGFLGSSHDIDLQGEWVGEQVLGAGAYGSVGLWRQRDENGLISDEMAIKQQGLHPQGLDLVIAWLQREAAVQRDLQRMEADMKLRINNRISGMIRNERYNFDPSAATSRNIVHLRKYKLNTQADLIRLYQINCSHGSLATLIARYRAFDQIIPEPFIWHVFHSLSIANLLLSEPPHASSPWLRAYGMNPRLWFYLHRDIKPDNIFLDYAPTRPEDLPHYYDSDDLLRDVTRSYPTVALGDFGLSTYTSALPGLDPNHPTWGCTTGYHPPEQKYIHVDEDGTEPPPWRRFGEQFNPPIYRAGQPWTASHNLWVFAKIMLDMTFGFTSDVLHPVLSQLTQQHFQANGRHFLSQRDQRSFRRHGYSRDLLDLIRDCLYPEPNRRPNPQQVVMRTAHGMRDHLRKVWEDDAITNEERVGRYRLYYQGREIEELGLGHRVSYPVRRAEYQVARGGLPVNQELRFPPAKWANFEGQLRPRHEPGQFVHQGNGVNFGDDPADVKFVIHEDSPDDSPNGDQPQNPERHGSRSASPAQSPLERPEPSPISSQGPQQPDPHADPQADPQNDPTREQYMQMTIAGIVTELHHRNHEKSEVKRLQKARGVKRMYVDLLIAADAAGNRGRGVHRRK